MSQESFSVETSFDPTTRDALLSGDTPESTVSIRVVQGLVQAAERSGVPRAQLLRAAHLDPALLDAVDGRMPRPQVYRLCEFALDLTGDPALGLHWGERITGSFAPISPLLAHASSFRQALETLLHFERLMSDRSGYQFLETEDELTIRCMRLTAESVRVRRFCNEVMLVGFLGLARHFHPNANPKRVNLAYGAPSYHTEYARLFLQAVHFDEPFTEIVFDRALLNAASPQKDEDVHEALRTVAERRIYRLGQRAPYALRVRDLLVRHGPHQTDMKEVALALGMSVRSLRRRLAAESKPYNGILNEAFALVAKHHLRDKQLTIQETAYEMGFSDTSTFHRAFKRWTGMTPAGFRESASRDR